MSNAIYGPIPDPHPPIQNKYYKWYINICRSKQKERGYFTQSKKPDNLTKHHIIPDCFYINSKRKRRNRWLIGNPNTKINLVFLTDREHFLVHWILTKCFSNNVASQKVHNAFKIMRELNPTSRYYEISRKNFIGNLKGAKHFNYIERVEFKCTVCDKIILIYPKLLETKKFCSRICHDINKKQVMKEEISRGINRFEGHTGYWKGKIRPDMRGKNSPSYKHGRYCTAM